MRYEFWAENKNLETERKISGWEDFSFFLLQFAFEFPISLLLLHTLPCVVHSNLIWLWNEEKTRPEDAGKRERRKKHQQDIGQNETSRWNPFGRFIPCMLVGCLFRCAQDVKHLLLECLIMCFRFFSLFSFSAATFFDVFYSLLIRLMVERNGFRMRCQRIIRFRDIVCKQQSLRVWGEGIARWPNIQMDPSQMRSCNVFLHFGSILKPAGDKHCGKMEKYFQLYLKTVDVQFWKKCTEIVKKLLRL